VNLSEAVERDNARRLAAVESELAELARAVGVVLDRKTADLEQRLEVALTRIRELERSR
jgi:hypothetical protein